MITTNDSVSVYIDTISYAYKPCTNIATLVTLLILIKLVLKSGHREIQIPTFIIISTLFAMIENITFCFIVIFTSLILKSLNPNSYPNNYSINTSFKCSQFPACDITAWTSELKYWEVVTCNSEDTFKTL